MSAVCLDQHLRVAVDPQLPAALISPPRLAALHGLARGFPADISEFFGFECKLCDPAAAADFLVCIKAAEAGRAVLAGLVPGAELTASFVPAAAWARIRAFAAEWARPGSPLHQPIQNMWLEFDIDKDEVPEGVPSVFMGTDALQGGGRARTDWLTDHALPALRGAPVDERLAASLDTVLRALPAHSHIFQVGLMLGRAEATDALRVCIRGLSAAQAGDFLARVAGPAPKQRITVLLEFAHASSTSVDLDLDLCPEVGPKIGLECAFGEDARTPKRIATFLDGLVEMGACLPAKRDALLAWPGGFHERANPDAWPADLSARARSAGQSVVSMFMRWLYHIKLVHVPDKPVEAKAYLAVRQAWITPEFVRQMKLRAQEPAMKEPAMSSGGKA